MNTIQQIQSGISAYKQAHEFIKTHSFLGYFILPLIFNFLLFLFFSGLIWHYSVTASDKIYFASGIDEYLQTDFKFIRWMIKASLFIILNIGGLIIYLLIFKSIVLVLMAPVLTIVSEKTESIVTGKTFSFTFLQFMKDVLRGVILAIKNLFKEILLSVLLLIVSFIPLIGFVSPLMLFLVQSYFYGFSMFDYSLERNNYSVSQSENWIWQHKTLVITIGAVFNFLLIISTTFSVFPSFFVSFLLKIVLLIPLVVLSVIPIYSTVAATLAYLKTTTPQTPIHE